MVLLSRLRCIEDIGNWYRCPSAIQSTYVVTLREHEARMHRVAARVLVASATLGCRGERDRKRGGEATSCTIVKQRCGLRTRRFCIFHSIHTVFIFSLEKFLYDYNYMQHPHICLQSGMKPKRLQKILQLRDQTGGMPVGPTVVHFAETIVIIALRALARELAFTMRAQQQPQRHLNS